MAEATKDQVLKVLDQVQEPDLHKGIVSLGFVKDVAICGGAVSFTIELTTPACPVRGQLESEAKALVSKIPGVEQVSVKMTSNVPSGRAPVGNVLAGVRNTIAVASGKGGVGKSTVAANLALALAQSGARAGLMDCDIYGPSVPTMFGISRQPQISADKKVMPLEAHGIKLMSMGFLATPDSPVIWRGPMVHGILQQFLTVVAWGELDYLVLDLPPGTGDAQLTLTQTAPLSGAVIVTTPQDVSLIDARKGLKMFEQVRVPVLGIVENMSGFACPHCGKATDIFKRGGGARTAQELGVPFLGEIPIDAEVVTAGDCGVPIVAKNPNSPAARAFLTMAEAVAARLSTVTLQGAGAGKNLDLQWK